ncbi:hypothetical protein B484DRAFT_443075 [Ochromonadaceae sp. CCMP2298]|nr:hypothetical protein B484DRAFT_443075 [Ochromonadaceae sp. CCMP2298]
MSTPLDVLRAERALLPHSSGAIMGPKETTRSRLDAQGNVVGTEGDENGDENRGDNWEGVGADTGVGDTGASAGVGATNLDVLSYRPRTPAFRMREPTHDRVRTHAQDIDLGTPGPGAYDVKTDSNLLRGRKSAPVGALYHTASKPKKEEGMRQRDAAAAALGPGAYNADKSFRYASTKQPTCTMRRADSKPTPQMVRKQYFEQKARDMREVHDHMHHTDEALLYARTPGVTLAPQWSADPKRARILTNHRLAQVPPGARGSSADRARRTGGALSGILSASLEGETEAYREWQSVDKRYSQVQRRTLTGAFMAAEVTARRSTADRTSAKPGVVSRLADQKMGPLAKQRFYGPQLPVAWAGDEGAGMGGGMGGGVGMGGAGDEGYDSPGEEVAQMLAERSGTGTVGRSDGGDTEFSKAYLKGRYSGSLHPKKPAVTMDVSGQERSVQRRKLTVEEEAFEFLGPQLQPEWGGGGVGGRAVQMGLVPGRETRKAHQKGELEVIPFDARPQKTEDIGPGHYETDTAQKALGLPFSKAVSRAEQVGPFGQRPAAHADEALEDSEFGDLYFHEQLDFDFASAKDEATKHKRAKAVALYAKDRHGPTPEPSVLEDHLGGSWHEKQGMAERAKGGPAVDFDRMRGREGPQRDAEEAAMEAELGLGPAQGQGLDLEVSDWHPEKAQAAGYAIRDPKKHPRFEKPIAPAYVETEGGAPLPNYDYNRAKPAVIDMARMQGRADAEGEETVLRGELEGEGDITGGAELAAERDKALGRGADALSGAKRPTFLVDMERQVGFNDNDVQEQLGAMQEQLDGRVKMYDNSDLTTPHLKHPDDIGRGGGARDWGKIPGRTGLNAAADADADAVLAGDEALQLREELQLDPVKDGTSRHQRFKSAPAWDKGAGTARFEAGAEEGEAVGLGVREQLDLQDVDPGRFKSGMQGFGDKGKSKGTKGAMNNQGRDGGDGDVGGRARQVAGEAAGLGWEELDLSPGDNPMVKRQPAATLSRAGAGDVRAGAGEAYALRELGKEGALGGGERALKLSPRAGEAYLQKNIRGSTSMLGVVGVEDAGLSQEELLLDEEGAANKLRAHAPSASLRSTDFNAARASRHMRSIEAENRASATSLALHPSDSAARRVAGTSMRSAVPRDQGEGAAGTREWESGELIILPNDGTNASAAQKPNQGPKSLPRAGPKSKIAGPGASAKGASKASARTKATGGSGKSGGQGQAGRAVEPPAVRESLEEPPRTPTLRAPSVGERAPPESAFMNMTQEEIITLMNKQMGDLRLNPSNPV